jgi:hypothetical protein
VLLPSDGPEGEDLGRHAPEHTYCEVTQGRTRGRAPIEPRMMHNLHVSLCICLSCCAVCEQKQLLLPDACCYQYVAPNQCKQTPCKHTQTMLLVLCSRHTCSRAWHDP